MNSTILSDAVTLIPEHFEMTKDVARNLTEAEINQEYLIKGVEAGDSEIANFLFTLGCFKGETITLISILSESYVISIKDARYSIGSDLAQAVLV